ncbi:MAG: sodium:alanine symporter family protein, partial [Rhodospirillaceae bacterium]|nr:sodium:alanine symporter family protein [Rhodospirillaceae bacterium]
MHSLTQTLSIVSEWIWLILMFPLLGIGVFLTLGLKCISITRLPEALGVLFSKESTTNASGEGEISPFKALMTA